MLRVLLTRAIPIAIGILLLGVILAVITAVRISNAMIDVDDAQKSLSNQLDRLTSSQATELTLDDFNAVSTATSDLNQALRSLDARTNRFQSMAPLVGRDLEVQIELMRASIHLTSGVQYFLNGMAPTIRLLQREGVLESDEVEDVYLSDTTRRLVDLMDAGQTQFDAAEFEIQRAQEMLDALDLNGISVDLMLDVRDLQDLAEMIQSYNALAQESPQLLTTALGIGQQRTYLVLAENNDELRPSGGYISTWGWMQVRNGRIQDQEYFPTTSRSPIPPSDSVAASFEVPTWWGSYSEPVYAAWDGSWYADFAKTAEMAAWYYNNGNNPSRPVDGVIGVDLIAVEYLVEALGEIYVPEYNVIVDSENFRAAIYEIRAERDAPLEHKKFVGALFASIIKAWQRADLDTQSAVNRALLQSLREKHLMLYFDDEAVQNAFKELNWSGSQSETQDHDYLMVADANIRANKSSSSVYRQTTYDVEIENGGEIQSHLSIFYDFPAYLAEQDPAFAPEHYGFNKDYGSLVQIFTPSGSSMVSGTMSTPIEVVELPNYTDMVGFMNLPFDDSASIEIDYTNAYETETVGPYKLYRLLVQKQPGMRNEPANVTISLPTGASVIWTSPSPSARYSLGRPVLEFNFRLRQDQWIEILYK